MFENKSSLLFIQNSLLHIIEVNVFLIQIFFNLRSLLFRKGFQKGTLIVEALGLFPYFDSIPFVYACNNLVHGTLLGALCCRAGIGYLDGIWFDFQCSEGYSGRRRYGMKKGGN